jgi:hypothetical protein
MERKNSDLHMETCMLAQTSVRGVLPTKSPVLSKTGLFLYSNTHEPAEPGFNGS